jgi:septation ring formation regulator EzrA
MIEMALLQETKEKFERILSFFKDLERETLLKEKAKKEVVKISSEVQGLPRVIENLKAKIRSVKDTSGMKEEQKQLQIRSYEKRLTEELERYKELTGEEYRN